MKKLLILPLLAIALFACKKDKDDPQNIDSTPIPEPKVTAMPLAVGNYWVYELFSVDPNGIASSQNHFDSLYISGTQVLNGDTFYVIKGSNAFLFRSHTNFTEALLRDSTGYLIDETGYIYYAENNYNDTLSSYISSPPEPAYRLVEYMANKNNAISVPAGTFTQTGTLFLKSLISEPNYPHETTRHGGKSFAKNTGLIKSRSFFYGSPDYIEYRLARYHVN